MQVTVKVLAVLGGCRSMDNYTNFKYLSIYILKTQRVEFTHGPKHRASHGSKIMIY